MKRSSAKLFQLVIVLIGIAAMALLLWEPQTEGVNAHATNFEIYFKDPFLALVYTGSIPFFVALYQAFRVLGYVKHDRVFSDASVHGVRMIKYCAIAIIGFVAAEELFILLNHGNDDPAGGVFIGIVITVLSIVVARVALRIERILHKGVEVKTANNLTV